jgi:hypothetical protein
LSKTDPNKIHKAESRLKKGSCSPESALRLCRSKSAREYEDEVSIKLFRLKKLAWLGSKEREINEIELEKQLLRRALDRKELN